MAVARKKSALETMVWNDASEPSKGGIFFIPGKGLKVRITDEATWAKWKSEGIEHMPGCIIKYLMKDQSAEDEVVLELKCPEERYVVGESVTVESIETEGALILTTPQGQSELVFPATGTDVVAFKETDFILQGDPYDFQQYLCDLPDQFLENRLYPYIPPFPPGNTKTLGQTVQYDLKLKDPSLFTVRVIRSELKRSPLLTVTGQTLGGEFSLSIGMGFQTFDRHGIVMEMCTAGQDTGTITKWRELWDQDHFTRCYPNVLQALRPYSLLETDVLRTDKVQLNFIRRVFKVKPIALLSPQDMNGSGSRFIVGVVSNAGNGPIILNGVMAPKGEEVLRMLYDEVILIQKENLEAYLPQLRAGIENGLHAIQDYKPESSKSPSPFELLMPGQLCMSLLYHCTTKSRRKSAFTHNNLTIKYDGDWKALEPIMGRNARETILSDGCKLVAGQAKFKWMMLPYSRLVVSLSFVKLLSRGGSASHLDTTNAGLREFNSKLNDSKYCKLCLHRKFDGSCTTCDA
jgi:hypothetical protein